MGTQKRRRLKEDIRNISLEPLPDYPGYYITKEGKVISVMELTPYEDKDGYKRVHVFKDKKHKRPGLHVLLAKTFLPPPNEDQCVVRHLDGDNTNLSLNNLAWGTHKENGEDKARHGSVKGSKNPKAKLVESQVLDIKKKLKTMSIKDVSKQYPQVSTSTIEAISSGQNWSHVKLA